MRNAFNIALLTSLICLTSSLVFAQYRFSDRITWLDQQKQEAIVCVQAFKAASQQSDQNKTEYGDAKADYDGVIGGLISAVQAKENVSKIGTVPQLIKYGGDKLNAFCSKAHDLQSTQKLSPANNGLTARMNALLSGAKERNINLLKCFSNMIRSNSVKLEGYSANAIIKNLRNAV